MNNINGQRGFESWNPSPTSLRCPICRQRGVFEHTDAVNVKDLRLLNQDGEQFLVGHRFCPDFNCRTHVLIILDHHGRLIASFPPELIDFDSKNVPKTVSEALEEALSCHAHGCHKAAAMMVRKTLEELCRDQSITGDNLKMRVSKLKDSSIVPQGLMDGVDNLRLLGNDAAHVDAKDFDEIGEEELEVSIEFTKELLKAVYQYKDLTNRLEALKLKSP